MMHTPRCGLADVAPKSSPRWKRYVLYDTHWDKKDLTYSLQSFPDQNLTRDETQSIIREAFKRWSDVSALTFTELDSVDGQEPVITLNFFRGDHGDGAPFDGPGRVLAHTYIPPDGKVHFDNDELWTDGTSDGQFRGTDLRYTATHELGHAIGLKHSPEPDSIMRPYFVGQADNGLSLDDVQGVQALYGPPMTITGEFNTMPTETTASAMQPVTMETAIQANNATYSTTVETESETESGSGATETENHRRLIPWPLKTKVDWCFDGQIDIVLMIGQHLAYAFRDNVYAKLKEDGIDAEDIHSIADDWPGLESNLDAAFHWPADYEQPIAYTYFFKADLCWKYTLSRELASGYPRPIREEFPGIPDDLNAVLVLNPRTFNYFIKGSTFYRYNRSERRVYPGYPLSLYTWKELPRRVDAAVKWRDARTYFFRAEMTYLVNSNRVEPGYPKSTAETWLGCSKRNER